MKGIRGQGVVHTLDGLFMHDHCGSTTDDRTGWEVGCFKKARVNCGRVTGEEMNVMNVMNVHIKVKSTPK